MAHRSVQPFFGRPFVKRFNPCYRSVVCLSCLSVCNVDVLWPNGWTDPDETWHAGRSRPWRHCVRSGPSSPPQRGTAHKLSVHICCGQIAGWIKMPHGRQVGLGRRDNVLDGDPLQLPSPKRRWSPLPNFRCISIVTKRLDASTCHLVWR